VNGAESGISRGYESGWASGSVIFGPAGYDSSTPSITGGAFHRTEPRNFRPAGLVTHEPPPRFMLATPAQGRVGAPTPAPMAEPITSSHTDPFSMRSLPGLMQPIAPAAGDVTPAPYGRGRRAPPDVRVLRSEQLNKITNSPTGRPLLNVVLDPANFPFIESTRQCGPASHGVVKIKNASYFFPVQHPFETCAFLFRTSKAEIGNANPNHRFPTPPNGLKLSLSSVVIAGS
jgi:hypothetical protein